MKKYYVHRAIAALSAVTAIVVTSGAGHKFGAS